MNLPSVAPAAGLSPARLWELFAGRVGSAGRVRLARDRREFRAAWERRLDPSVLPVVPAAVRTFDAAGDSRCVVFDLDAKRPELRPAMLRDCERLTGWLTDAGCVWFVDESPHGGRGRHVYVPLDHARGFAEISSLFAHLKALKLLPTLDTGPMVNLRGGCIRPPGSPHRYGGHQRLVTDLQAAIRAVTVGTDRAGWAAFRALLPRDLQAGEAAAAPPVGRPIGAMDGSCRPLAPTWAAIAATGSSPEAGRWASPSELRYTVLLHALRRGWTTDAVTDAVSSRRWPGLRQLYVAKHGLRYWPKALAADLDKASSTITAHPFQQRHTSAAQTRGGGLDLMLRRLAAAVTCAIGEGRWSTQAGYGVELVLAALAAAGRRSGSTVVEHGVRHLAYGAGSVLDPAQVAKILKALRAEDDPFILLVDADRGAGADVYELRIPDRYDATVPTDPAVLPVVPRGVHPAFGLLPRPAYRLYTALTARGTTATAAELGEAGSVPTSSVYATLTALKSAGLVRQVAGGRWILGRRSLDRYARLNGVAARLLAIVRRNRAERAAWRALLGLPDRTYPPTRAVAWPGHQPRPAKPPALARSAAAPPARHPTPPPPSDALLHAADPANTDWTTSDGLEHATLTLLQDILGARPITDIA